MHLQLMDSRGTLWIKLYSGSDSFDSSKVCGLLVAYRVVSSKVKLSDLYLTLICCGSHLIMLCNSTTEVIVTNFSSFVSFAKFNVNSLL